MFAPGFGIPEDPATGIAAGPLGCYLVHHTLVPSTNHQPRTTILNTQGVKMGRPSRLHIAITERNGQIAEVKVGGQAVLVARGDLLV
jgi:trans-2,3-dihydro-3-hydroxyanthranilate isomerase